MPFFFFFSSGAVVRYKIYPWSLTYFANIEVHVPSDDFQNTVGLCGTLDKNNTNEKKKKSGMVIKSKYNMVAPKDFSENWKYNCLLNIFFYDFLSYPKILRTLVLLFPLYIYICILIRLLISF